MISISFCCSFLDGISFSGFLMKAWGRRHGVGKLFQLSRTPSSLVYLLTFPLHHFDLDLPLPSFSFFHFRFYFQKFLLIVALCSRRALVSEFGEFIGARPLQSHLFFSQRTLYTPPCRREQILPSSDCCSLVGRNTFQSIPADYFVVLLFSGPRVVGPLLPSSCTEMPYNVADGSSPSPF